MGPQRPRLSCPGVSTPAIVQTPLAHVPPRGRTEGMPDGMGRDDVAPPWPTRAARTRNAVRPSVEPNGRIQIRMIEFFGPAPNARSLNQPKEAKDGANGPHQSK